MASAKPCPRSPPRRRSKIPAEAQISDGEIGFLKERTDGEFNCEQEELQSLEGLPSVHGCCKEVHEFVGSNPDPLIPPYKKKQKSCRMWEWLRTNLCCNSSWMCSSCACSLQPQTLCCPNRRKDPNPETCCCCCSCRGTSCCGPPTQCLQPSSSRPGRSRGPARSSCPDCIGVRLCPKRCTETCCSDQRLR